MHRHAQLKGIVVLRHEKKTVLMHRHAQLKRIVVLRHRAFGVEHTDQPCAFTLEDTGEKHRLSRTPVVFFFAPR